MVRYVPMGSLTPADTNLEDDFAGLYRTFGTRYSRSTAAGGSTATITAVRWYAPATLPSATVEGVVYDSSLNELARVEFTNPTAGAWNEVALPSPIVTSGTAYTVAVGPLDRWVRTVAGLSFEQAPLAVANPGLRSSPREDPVHELPAGTEAGTTWFVDVVVESDVWAPQRPGTGVITRSLPAPAVLPVIALAADTSLPVSEATFTAGVEAQFLAARQWYWDLLGGYTWKCLAPYVYRDPRTTAAINAAYPSTVYAEGYHWTEAIVADLAAAGYSPATRTRFPAVVSPNDVTFTVFGYWSSTGDPFGHCAVGIGQLGRACGGVVDQPGDFFPPGQVTTSTAVKVIAHELGHGLGCRRNGSGGFDALEHPGENGVQADPDDERIMGGGGYPAAVFIREERERILQSPYLVAQDRPTTLVD